MTQQRTTITGCEETSGPPERRDHSRAARMLYALGAVPWGSSRSAQAVSREAVTVYEGQHGAHPRRGRLSPWHLAAPTACPTATAQGLSGHRKERYGTLQ